MLTKEIAAAAAIQAGQDAQSEHDPEVWIEWASQAAQFIASVAKAELWYDLVNLSANLTQSDAAAAITHTITDLGKILSATRGGTIADIHRDPLVGLEQAGKSGGLLAASATSPALYMLDGLIYGLPIPSGSSATWVLRYLRTLTLSDETYPIAPSGHPAAIAYIAGRALSADGDSEAISAAKSKLEEAGLLLFGGA